MRTAARTISLNEKSYFAQRQILSKVLTAILRRSLGVVILVLCLGLTACKYKEEFSWNQKMTIVVQTPDGDVKASSVSSVFWGEQKRKWQGMGYDFTAKGEAVILDLGDGKYLFGLLRGAGTSEYMGSVAPASISGRKGRVISNELFREVAEKRGRASGVISVPEYQYPLLVTFEDISKPESVKRVDPADLAASFGEGHALKSVSLEVTDEQAAEGEVEKILGWMFDPRVMRNPGWKSIPIEVRRLLSGYIQPFPNLGDDK
jgi:hypothetical protein